MFATDHLGHTPRMGIVTLALMSHVFGLLTELARSLKMLHCDEAEAVGVSGVKLRQRDSADQDLVYVQQLFVEVVHNGPTKFNPGDAGAASVTF